MADKWTNLPATSNPLPSRRQQPMDVPVPNTSDYPNNVKNTDTIKVRGTGAATKGTTASSRLA